jgi:hypothetical protein
MSDMISVNWHQEKAAADGLVRVHRVLAPQPAGCRFPAMKDYDEYGDIADAEKAMRCRHRKLKRYKRCSHCWDGTIIDLES